MKWMFFLSGTVVGLTTLSIALGSVPTGHSQVTDDTALYQRLSEIRVPKGAALNFDGDIARLSQLEGSYRESLPTLSQNPRLIGPMKRISSQKYRYQSRKKQQATRE